MNGCRVKHTVDGELATAFWSELVETLGIPLIHNINIEICFCLKLNTDIIRKLCESHRAV